ncbi:MAG: DUF5107 domain-containing protein [Bacteroidetes bacterium]|nr:DUF5107 domain-containing protein [Bacteroidota bacterium]
MQIHHSKIDGIDIIICENDFIRLAIAPGVGGKITSIFNKELGKEFLWKNENLLLQQYTLGTDYDTHFYGGFDELLPSDSSETVDGIDYPDHGELWTTALDFKIENDLVSVFGKLELSGLVYKKTLRLEKDSATIYLDYCIKNESHSSKNFLWKLHPALSIKEGDQLLTKANKAKLVDPSYSRFSNPDEFRWPMIEHTDASLVPAKSKSMDFFYLYQIDKPEMAFWDKKADSLFLMEYDKKIFPYQWYFASYGGFQDHYTAIPEPCSTMPISINEAAALNQCTVLAKGEELNTTVKIYAGKYRQASI